MFSMLTRRGLSDQISAQFEEGSTAFEANLSTNIHRHDEVLSLFNSSPSSSTSSLFTSKATRAALQGKRRDSNEPSPVFTSTAGGDDTADPAADEFDEPRDHRIGSTPALSPDESSTLSSTDYRHMLDNHNRNNNNNHHTMSNALSFTSTAMYEPAIAAHSAASVGSTATSNFDAGELETQLLLEQLKRAQADWITFAPFDISTSAAPFDLSDYIQSDSKASIEYASMPDFDLFNTTSSQGQLFPNSQQINMSFSNNASPFARHAQFDQSLQSPLGVSPLESPADEFFSPYLDSTRDTMTFSSPSIAVNDLFPDAMVTRVVEDNNDEIIKAEHVDSDPALSGGPDSVAAAVKHNTRSARPKRINVEEDDIMEEDEEFADSFKSRTKRSSTSNKRRAESVDSVSVESPRTHSTSTLGGARSRPKKDLLKPDEPIQRRIYAGDSRTSRKGLPRAIARALPRNLLESVDPVTGELPPDVMNAVEKRREQNTRAARLSRAKKAEAQAALEQELIDLRQQVSDLQARLAFYESDDTGPSRKKIKTAH